MAEPGITEKPVGPAAVSSSSNVIDGAAKGNVVPPREIPPFLRPLTYMGVPKSVLAWQPRLPSRNWTIFLTVTTTLTSLYVYDRNECKKIRQEYKDRVQFLAEQSLHPREYPRKVIVYAAKSPGDDDYDKNLLYFKKYVKVS
jgi:import inner membrane translocase subunit TIM54